jgi:hypothetical protein
MWNTMCEMIRTLHINKGKETSLTSKVSRIIHDNIYGSAHELEKDSSNIRNTCFAMTRSWFSKVSNITAKCSIWIYPNMEKTRMSSMGSITSLSRYSKKMDSYVVWTWEKYWSDQRHEDVLQWNTTSRNIIKIGLGTEFDLTIAPNQIEGGKITYPKRRYYLTSTRKS